MLYDIRARHQEAGRDGLTVTVATATVAAAAAAANRMTCELRALRRGRRRYDPKLGVCKCVCVCICVHAMRERAR